MFQQMFTVRSHQIIFDQTRFDEMMELLRPEWRTMTTTLSLDIERTISISIVEQHCEESRTMHASDAFHTTLQRRSTSIRSSRHCQEKSYEVDLQPFPSQWFPMTKYRSKDTHTSAHPSSSSSSMFSLDYHTWLEDSHHTRSLREPSYGEDEVRHGSLCLLFRSNQ